MLPPNGDGKGNGKCNGKCNGNARTRQRESYIPTHRDETAMNGATRSFVAIQRKQATAKSKI